MYYTYIIQSDVDKNFYTGFPDTQLELARHLELIDETTWKQFDNKLLEEDKVLSGLIKSQKETM
jgi:hypothetical protein